MRWTAAGLAPPTSHPRCLTRRLLSGKHSLQTPPGPPPSAAQLAAFARQQWEALLLYLVSGEGTPPQAPPQLQAQSANLAQLLAEAGLMLKDEFTLAQSEHGGYARAGGCMVAQP